MLGKKIRVEIIDGKKELTINKFLTDHEYNIIDIKIAQTNESFKLVVIYQE